MEAGPGSLCLVANELAHVDRGGGIGTSNWLLAHLLADHGWRVHILLFSPVPCPRKLAATKAQLRARGITCTHLDELHLPADVAVPGWPHLREVEVSERVSAALQLLHREHHFN